MKYQLVFQFQGNLLEDLDATIALEEDLVEELGNSAIVDGHDVGSGKTNIFVFTSDPAETFLRAKVVLERSKQLQSVTVAYRDAKGDRFTVIWPEGFWKDFRVI